MRRNSRNKTFPIAHHEIPIQPSSIKQDQAGKAKAKQVLNASEATLVLADQTNADIADAKARNEALIKYHGDVYDRSAKIATMQL